MNRLDLNRLDRDAVRQSFDRASGAYDRHAVLQHEVEQRLLERLEYLRREPDSVLDVGCGTGIACHALSVAHGGASIIGLDWARGMLDCLLKRGTGAGAPVAVCADMQAIPLAARSIDLIFSNLALQWSPDPGGLFAEFRRVIRPGGMVLFSTFGPDTLHELRSAWASADDHPHVNLFADMHDIGDLVVAAGFVEPVFDVDVITLEYGEVKGLMRDLKAIGAHNVARGRAAGLTGKRKFAQVLEAYEKYRRGGKYPATYEVIYGAAFGPQEGQPFRSAEGEVATFSVDSLKTGRGRS